MTTAQQLVEYIRAMPSSVKGIALDVLGDSIDKYTLLDIDQYSYTLNYPGYTFIQILGNCAGLDVLEPCVQTALEDIIASAGEVE